MNASNTLEYPKNYVPGFTVGRGAYGIVFSAQRPSINPETGEADRDEAGNVIMEDVAIKKIEDYACVDRGTGTDFKTKYLRRICREVDILLHFRSVPQIVETKEIYLSPDGRDLYIVMTFVPLSLDKLMRNPTIRDALSEDHVRWISVQILLGLSALHRAGCMHRDLSLGNILFDPSTMDCFIADFGLSRVQFDVEQDISLDVVSLPYRAPEVLLQCGRYQHTVDVWSIGCVLMELILKKPFLHAKDALWQLIAIMKEISGFIDLDEWKDKASTIAINYFTKMKTNNPDTLPSPKDVGQRVLDAGYSHDAADVLRRMLVFHPDRRATVVELLAMPWFQDDAHCKEAIQMAEQGEGLQPCPFAIESMQYNELIEHMKSCCTPGVIPTECVSVGSQPPQ